MSRELSEAELTQIRNSFRRCSHETVDAIIRFREEGDPVAVTPIVYGIIERYAPAESATKVAEMDENTKLIEDLGIDSLTMLEVVLSIEEALSIRIENEELIQIRTLGEVKGFIEQKLAGASAGNAVQTLTRDEIIVTLPQQPPFLFLESAEIEGDTARARYTITGDEHFLEGHFKDNPVFPASIVFEAIGQACCLWVLTQAEAKLGKPLHSHAVLFGSMESAHFFRKAKPGETLDLEVNLSKLREPLAVFNGKASVNGEKLSTVEELVIVFGEAAEKGGEATRESTETTPRAEELESSTEEAELKTEDAEQKLAEAVASSTTVETAKSEAEKAKEEPVKSEARKTQPIEAPTAMLEQAQKKPADSQPATSLESQKPTEEFIPSDIAEKPLDPAPAESKAKAEEPQPEAEVPTPVTPADASAPTPVKPNPESPSPDKPAK